MPRKRTSEDGRRRAEGGGVSGVTRHECGGGVGVIRMGVIGAGWIAREHRRVLDSVAEAELVAVCDLDRERAGELAAGTGARAYTD